MKSDSVTIILFVILLFLMEGCSSPEVKNPDNKEEEPESQYATHVVEISRMQFIPAEISVKKGDQIIFVNHDLVNHDVTEDSKAWSSSTLAPEKYWTLTATVSQHYYCTIHVVMKGSIKVE